MKGDEEGEEKRYESEGSWKGCLHAAFPHHSNIATSGIHKSSLSDHCLVFCVRKFRGAGKTQHKNISTRQMKKV